MLTFMTKFLQIFRKCRQYIGSKHLFDHVLELGSSGVLEVLRPQVKAIAACKKKPVRQLY